MDGQGKDYELEQYDQLAYFIDHIIPPFISKIASTDGDWYQSDTYWGWVGTLVAFAKSYPAFDFFHQLVLYAIPICREAGFTPYEIFLILVKPLVKEFSVDGVENRYTVFAEFLFLLAWFDQTLVTGEKYNGNPYTGIESEQQDKFLSVLKRFIAQEDGGSNVVYLLRDIECCALPFIEYKTEIRSVVRSGFSLLSENEMR